MTAVDLHSHATRDLEGVGGAPRHLQISPDGAFLYVTLNRDGIVAKVDATTGNTVAAVHTG